MIDLKVDGMTCGGCASAVTKAVKRADPAAEVAVDLPTGRVTVETTHPRDSIVEAIEGAGYEVAA